MCCKKSGGSRRIREYLHTLSHCQLAKVLNVYEVIAKRHIGSFIHLINCECEPQVVCISAAKSVSAEREECGVNIK